MKAIWILGAVTGLPLSMTVPALAHHSNAMFDMRTTATVEGDVKEFQWTNPHGYLVVTPAEGSRDWVLELDGIQEMAADGVRNDTFKPGERVTVTYHPVRSGNPVGRFVSATWEDGREINASPD